VLRSAIDAQPDNGRFLILGSASQDLIQQTSETLAGRISFVELTPFFCLEAPCGTPEELREFWLKGGFPRSFLEIDQDESFAWRGDFIRTFMQRDIPRPGFRVSPGTMERLWLMCAHLHGNLVNLSQIGESLGLSHHTVRSYLELLEQTFMLRLLRPYAANLKKRLVKSPKLYLRDSGVLHALHEIRDQNDLFGHPIYGASWEGFVIENLLAGLPDWRAYFYRTQAGGEIDLILQKGLRRIAVECKSSSAPEVPRGFVNALDDLQIQEAFVVSPVGEPYPIRRGITVTDPRGLLDLIGPAVISV
jgi:predicted AAA+ superfamily ATPase